MPAVAKSAAAGHKTTATSWKQSIIAIACVVIRPLVTITGTVYVLEHINSSLCSPASRMGRQNSRRDSRSWRPPSVAVGATCFARASGEQAHESAAGKLSH